ncbi:glycosyltransferase [Erythrobacter litoralis]|uniref:glycosyltransferase family 2 protein n=1 Tax=Erythrobacter litoralis TaxID=39960 RepID=UPI002435CDB3|nr:glycosyltransferase [Erythrobacter litoralis]MDG6078813.1 glycosyltransferase [Erythrobacter litoralis]
MTEIADTRATVIVTQRERFGMTEESLDSLYDHIGENVDVVVVDGNSPPSKKAYLEKAAKERGFTLIRRDAFLTPNQARNLGVGAASTKYVVFADNDVIYSQNWLENLIACAEETGAAVVAPLTCQGLPAHTEIHHAGGDYAIDGMMDDFMAANDDEQRPFDEVMHGHGDKLSAWQGKLRRQVTGMCEFHCVLVRKDVFEKTGPLDEGMLSTKEHIDFSIAVREAGEEVWFEPTSVITYVFPCRARPLNREDWPFFALRWSTEYGSRSLKHFIAKWRLQTKPDYVAEKEHIYATRRMQGILIPIMRQIPLMGRNARFARVAARASQPVEMVVNRALVGWHDRRR